MNRTALLFLFVLVSTHLWAQKEVAEQEIGTQLDAWHRAAAEADYGSYFDKMTDDGVFIGTDAMENWQNEAFRAFSKPYFDKGRAWGFTALQRNIYINETGDIAWFDELLDTQMKICRGSGVLKKIGGDWKVAHYVLSIAIPNEYVTEVVEIKRERDSLLTSQLQKKM